MKTTAIIIVRSGSLRVPKKNMQDFHGRPLVAHKVWQLKQCARIDDVIVGSDSDELLNAARLEGAICMKRKAEFCDEKSRPWNDVIYDMVSRTEGNGLIVWAHCTNPCIMPHTYDKAIEAFFGARARDSLIGVTELKTHIWYENNPLNFDPYATKHQVARNLLPAYIQHGGLFIAPRALMVKRRYVYGTTPHLFLMDQDESIDVDTYNDLERARALYPLVLNR